MANNKGFTLIEIMVVVIIVGVLAAMTLPNFTSSIELTKAQMVRNNLLAVSAAEQKYYEDHTAYFYAATTQPINSALNLDISDPFTYSCSAPVPAETINYNCTATDGTDTLTLNPNNVYPTSLVSCANVSGNSSYCPN